jgi:hypothetical protein
VVKTLEGLSLIKYWKGDHIISVTQKIVEEHLKWACLAVAAFPAAFLAGLGKAHKALQRALHAVLPGSPACPSHTFLPSFKQCIAPGAGARTIANQRNIEIDLNRLHWTPYRQEPPAKK